MSNQRINVTESFVPKMSEYSNYLQRAFDSKWLTNRGELTLELEDRLRQYLNLDNLLLTTNGTIPLQIAVELMGNEGEIITTSFSYIATTSSILWQHCTPVFIDIDPIHFTINETLIEAAITPKTTAILATHVFGNPCAIEAIEAIALKHNLYVIYDAAHCFGVNYNGKSVFKYGDISTCSFHATKVYHTGEGGAIVCNNPDFTDKVYYSHNFGHDGPLSFHGVGINGKISELQSAMGLAVLDNIETIFSSRKSAVENYDRLLNESGIQRMKIRENTDWNYCYYPIVLDSENTLLQVEKALNDDNIFPRRYFYPSLNTISFVNGPELPESESLSSRILCLPLFAGLTVEDIDRITSLILKNL